mmetsp:Transcript_16539/g.16476  ORF Transcript_16539/g.16476 Transcript_16539/m.16476 type:complete len:259 (+) Transcript_16539:242-1018(+)
MGDSEQKRRRYCLMCHVFKPERSHHCSACNRCVLNMDHHCPWINNCVGFYNRKFFILLLVYVLISTTLITITLFPTVYASVKEIIEKRDIYAYKEAVLFSAYLLNCLLNGVMFMFLKFHIKLIFTNITTIENMDKQNLPNLIVYNKGYKRNWIQVFGRNPWLWPFPMTGRSGKPVGDGVIWNDEVIQNFDEEIPANENEARRSSRLTGSGVAASRERLASPVRQGNSLEGTRKEFESTLDSSSRIKAEPHHVGLLGSP